MSPTIKTEGEKYWKERPVNDDRMDWRTTKDNWIKEYWGSQDHPHRIMLIEQMAKLGTFDNILEIGCNCGPNLALAHKQWPGIKVAGIDINEQAIVEGKSNLPEADMKVGKVDKLEFPDKSFDIVLADAVLMYVSPKKIIKVAREMLRVARKAIVIVDWFAGSTLGVIKYGHWARDYQNLFIDKFGIFHDVEKIKIPKEKWESSNWADIGNIFIVHLQ